MTDTVEGKPGEKRLLFCSGCDEEQIFIRAVWSGVEFYGYPPLQEHGWECSACGSRVADP